MQKLNELEKWCQDVVTSWPATTKLASFNHRLVRDVAEELRELEQRAEAAEAKYENRSPTEWAYQQACAAFEKHRARADAAEAKLAERDDQVSEAVGMVVGTFGAGLKVTCFEGQKRPCLGSKLFTHPAPAVTLAALVPGYIPKDVYQVIYRECGGFVDSNADAQVIWEACRAAILRNIEGAG